MASTLGALIANGRTSEVYHYGADGAAKVLKPSTPQHWAQVEATFTDEVRKLGVPAPTVRDVVDIDGRAAVIFQRIVGPSMWQVMVDEPATATTLVSELVDLQRSIHAAGVPAGLPSLDERLRLKIAQADELSDDEQRLASEMLDQQPKGAALLHGDLHPGNVLLGPDGLVVIDWFDAAVGHPDADIARTLLLLQPSGATDLRHLPEVTESLIDLVYRRFQELSLSAQGAEAPSPAVAAWLRLRAAGRLAERTDIDGAGLLACWRHGNSVSVHNSTE